MLSNLSTSILSDYSKTICVLVATSTLFSCSSIRPIKHKINNKSGASYCERTQSESSDERSLVFAAKNKSVGIINCFRNYLRFEKNKKQLIKTCTRLNIKRSGDVSFVNVLGVSPRNVPKDLKMCLEQEYWKMKFSGLQLEKSYSLKFPLNLSSI
jgi:hypothetical protein